MNVKRNLLNLGFGLLSVFLLFSCLDDSGDDVYVSYGVIQNVNSSNDYEIFTDNGNTLVVTKSQTTQEIEEGKRVLVSFGILSDENKSKNMYEVRVNGFYFLLSKPVVNESFILQDEEHRRDSIGNDPFNAIRTWYGGDFVNIDFEVFHSPDMNKKHMVNLIYDDVRVDTDTIYLTLRHNAFGEVPGKVNGLYRGIGRCSFKVADLLPQGITSMPIKITWTEYDGGGYGNVAKERSKSEVFKLGASENENKSFSKNGWLPTDIDVN